MIGGRGYVTRRASLRTVLVVVFIAWFLGGCARSSDDNILPTVTLDYEMLEHSQARNTGVLGAAEQNGVVYFTLEMGKELYGLVFPMGFAARNEDPVTLVDTDLQTVAVVGETVSFTGGQAADGGQLWASGPGVDGLLLAVPIP